MQSIKLERNFVNEKSISKYLKCFICASVYSEPIILKCGHTFCKICITQWLNHHSKCSECRSNIKEKDFQIDRIAAGIISELDVYCSNKKYGCKWKGVLDRLEVHQRKCTKTSANQDINEENELELENDPEIIFSSANVQLKDKKEIIDTLKSSNENTKNNNLEQYDPMAFQDSLQQQYPNKNPLDVKRKIDTNEDDLPKQNRERLLQLQNE